MAWSRDEARLPSSSFTAYAYTEVDWSIGETACTYRHLGGVTSPYGFGAQASAELEWWEGSWHDYDPDVTGSGTFSGYGDLKLCETTDSFARAETDRIVSLGCSVSMMGASARAWIDYTVPHLAPVVHWAEDDPVVRNSDNSITLTWDAPALEYSAMCLEVSIDGGSWSQFAVLWNTATSYTWTECSADHSYQFRIRSNYLASYSAYEVCPTVVVNTPAAPAALKVAATSGTNVTVTLDNPSTVATSTSYQLSTDGQTWTGAEVTGQSTSSFSVNMGANHYIRVKNVNSTGSSGWLVSGYIQTVTKPNPPRISASMQTWDIASNLTVSWVGSYPDGSSQTAYKYKTRINGGAWSETTVNPSTATSLTLTPAAAGVSVGDTFSISVATKGAASSFSDYPAELVIQVAQKPTVIVTSPGDEVSTMPIEVRATFSDTGNTCEAATCALKQGTAELYSEAMVISNGALSCDISEFLPDNNAAYSLEVYAISSTGLSQTAVVPFVTDFVEPQAGELNITNDPETGYVSLLATFDNSASDVQYSGDTNEQYESTEGYVRSLTVDGKSEKWNNDINASSYTFSNNTYNGVTYNGNVTIGLQLSGTATSGGNTNVAQFVRVNGHKYAILLSNETVVITDAQTWSTAAGSRIITANADGIIRLSHYRRADASYNTTLFVAAIDLTAIFGAGNEPSTVDAFKATDVYKAKLAAGELYGYDAGSLVIIEGAGVRGRNLADTSTLYNRYIQYRNTNDATWKASDDSRSFAIPVTAGTTYYVKTYNSSMTILRVACVENLPSGSEDISSTNAKSNALQYTITPTGNERYLIVQGSKSYLDGGTADIMVCTGDYHAYEPYSLTTITTPLRSAGSVHDTLMADADSWTVERRVGVVDLGTLTWTVEAAWQSSKSLTRYYAPLTGAPTTASENVLIPDFTANSQVVLSTMSAAYCCALYNGQLYITLPYPTFTNKSDLTTWLTSNPHTAFYELATPTQDADTSMSTIEIGTAFTIGTELDSSFEMVAWDGSADAVSVSVSRVNADETLTPLITDAPSGAGAVDKYAPLNTAYQYAVTTKSAAHAVKTVYVDNVLNTNRWFAYWGDNIAWARWNPKGGVTITRPEKKRVHYVGRTYPVSYDSLAIDQQNTLKVTALLDEWSDGFADLMRDGGRGVYKGADGSVFWADFEYSTSADYASATRIDEVSLTITRIDGEKL